MSRKPLLVLTLALAAACAATPSFADKKKDAKASAPAGNDAAPMTKDPIKLVPEGMKWGMSEDDLAKLMDKFIDADFQPKYVAAGKSGPKIKDLDAEVASLKAAFRRSKIVLDGGPTGLDSSPIAAEFSKGNGEFLMSHHRGPGVKIWFFFIQNRLWKTYEEVSLVDGGLYGKDMAEAAKKIVDSVGGTMPRQIPANPDKGQYYDVFDWQDKETHMRIWDRSGILAVVREEKSTVANLGNLRKNSSNSGAGTLDPSVAAVLRGSSGDDSGPKSGDDKMKDSKKKK